MNGQKLRFWWLGAVFCLIPISATLPGDRNLVFVGLAAAPALAMLLVGAADSRLTSRKSRAVVGALVTFNLALAPLLLPFKCLSTVGMRYMTAAAGRTIPRDATISQKTLVVVWTATEGPLSFAWLQRDAEGVPKPKRSRILAVNHGDVTVTRLDESTLRVRPDNGFIDHVVHRLGRDSSRPFRQGDRLTLSNMVATVTEIAEDWRPKTVEFRFTSPLESSEWLWMRGEGTGYVNWTPPRVGETVVIKLK